MIEFLVKDVWRTVSTPLCARQIRHFMYMGHKTHFSFNSMYHKSLGCFYGEYKIITRPMWDMLTDLLHEAELIKKQTGYQTEVHFDAAKAGSYVRDFHGILIPKSQVMCPKVMAIKPMTTEEGPCLAQLD